MTKPCHPACTDAPEPDEVRHHLTWVHPTHGKVTETACDQHLSLVHGAVVILGMGTIGERAEPGTPCTRCSNPHRTPRDFLAAASPSGLDVGAMVKALIDRADGDVILFSGVEWAADADEVDPAVLLLESWADAPGNPDLRQYRARVTATVEPEATR